MLEALKRTFETLGLEVRMPKEHPVFVQSLYGHDLELPSKDLELLSAAEVHAVVYGCIRAIANTAASVPFVVQRGDQILGDDHPATRILAHPSGDSEQQLSWHDLVEAIIWHMMLIGNAYIEVVQNRRGVPAELWPIHADNVRIVVNEQARISGYILEIGHEEVPLKPEEVLHFKLFHPKNAYFGLSPLAAVREGIITDISSVKYNKMIFQNMAIPSGLLMTEQVITEAEAERIAERWEKRFRGTSGKVAVLGRGVKFTPVTLPQKDIQFIQQRRFTREEIKMVLGVPGIVLYDTESATFAYAYVEQETFHEQTVFPILRKIEATFNQQLMGRFGKNVKMRFDETRVRATLQSTERRIEAHQRALQSGIPLWMIYQMIWNRPAPFPEEVANMAFIPANLVPLGSVNRAVTDELPKMQPEDTEGKKNEE